MPEGRSPVSVTRRTVLIGLGTSIAPMRFGVSPEIVVVELGAEGTKRKDMQGAHIICVIIDENVGVF